MSIDTLTTSYEIIPIAQMGELNLVYYKIPLGGPRMHAIAAARKEIEENGFPIARSGPCQDMVLCKIAGEIQRPNFTMEI